MFTKKEIAWIIVMLIIFEFIIIFPSPNTLNPLFLLVPIIILLVSILTKKISASFYHIKIEHKAFDFQRWGYYKRSHFKKPVAVGLFVPFLLSILSLGYIKMFTLLQFEYENITSTRILKQTGSKRKEEINDSDAAFTAAWGFFSLLILAIIGALPYIRDIFPDLTKYSIYYGFWNMIPFGKLDGNKLFFGSILVWFLLAIFYIIALLLFLVLMM